MPKQTANFGRNWYVLHTYVGYEEAVARNLRQRIDSMDMGDKIFNVLVPIEKKIKIKSGKRKTIEEHIYPGYVLVDMLVDDASWYVVRNTPRVTGFIGSGNTPVPISPDEMKIIQQKIGQEDAKFKIDFAEGDDVRITDGPFKDTEGKVDDVDETKGKVRVMVNIFGRETPVELDFLQIKKL
ncbi:transcription termination/antitermination factor NusG [bacterium]|nr:MAG: transcription termination/antitermination factor NusG [bacterium]